MPTYEYACPTCKRIEEQQHKMNDLFYFSCLKCSGSGNNYVMKRVISAPSVHFKGSGFYETDYK